MSIRVLSDELCNSAAMTCIGTLEANSGINAPPHLQHSGIRQIIDAENETRCPTGKMKRVVLGHINYLSNAMHV